MRRRFLGYLQKFRHRLFPIHSIYFIFEPSFFDLIDGDEMLLEREPLERAAEAGELMAYHHDGFWQCIIGCSGEFETDSHTFGSHAVHRWMPQ